MSENPLVLIAAFVVGTLAVGRAARLLTYDDMPWFAALRRWWVDHTGTWGSLFICPFCVSPYLAAGDLTWAILSGLHWDNPWSIAWWCVNVWAGTSYLAAIVVAYDEPAEPD